MPLIAAAPGAIVTWWFKQHEGAVGAYFLKDYEASATLLCLGWAGFITMLRSYADDYAAVSVSKVVETRDELLRLIAVIRIVVGVKKQRFHETLKSSAQSWTSGHAAFLAITQPKLQIREIVQAIYVFFDGAAAGDRIRVSLMRWDDYRGHLIFCEHYPPLDPPNAPASQFRDSTTAAGRAFFEKRMVIVEDVTRDGFFRRFENEAGSMFAFPVMDELDNRVAFIVNVCSDTKSRFTRAAEKQLMLPMKVFADRLILEDSLAAIRSKVEKMPVPRKEARAVGGEA